MRKKSQIDEETNRILKEKIKNLNKNSFKTTEVLFLIILTAIISLIVGYLLNARTKKNIVSDESLNEIIDNYYYIVDNYYDQIDKEKLVSGAIDGMVNSLGDEYSTLLSQDSSSSFYMNLEGSYDGIGIEIYNDEYNNIIVLDVLDDSPAEKAGIKSGDIVTDIDGKSFKNTNISELTKYIKESNHEKYIITVIRNDEEMVFELDKSKVIIKSVASKIIEKENHKIGYIYISVFSNSTSAQFKEELANLENEKIDSLIIDVRENSGGHLTTAVSILSQFLDSSHVIYQIEKNGMKTKYYSNGTKTKTYPIIVLQNSNSASASELLSVSLKEEYGAIIIGETSYGKGTVQEVVSLSNGDTYKFTTKKWLSPKGNWINGVGVVPDIEVTLNEEYKEFLTVENDNQLQTAINYILKES